MRVLLILGLMSGFCFAAEDEHVGPHKGPVAEWGEEEYHLEVVADAKTGKVTVYVYGDHNEFHKGVVAALETKTLLLALKSTKPATIIKLEAKPVKGDPEGKSSVFEGQHDVFKTEKKLMGTISGKLGKKPYSGDFGN